MTEGDGHTATLTLTITHTGPIELSELADSLNALSAQHGRFAAAVGAEVNGDRIRLYIREIRSGSIVVDLMALAMNYPMFGAMGAANTVISFAKHVRGLIGYFLGREAAPPPGTKADDARDLSRIVAPIAHDAGANLVIQARDNAVVVVTQQVTSNEANAIQNRARNFAAVQAQPISGMHLGRLFYWFQARDAGGKGVGDLGVIESITSRPVKTRFVSDDIKAAMLGEAIFRRAYIVDVEVQTREGKPTLYTVHRLLESFDRSDEPNELPSPSN